MAAGSIVVDLLLKTASFVTDSERAKKQFQSMKAGALEFGKAAATGFGVAAGAAGVAFAAISKLADDIAQYQDLADKIGDSAEAISGLQLAADQSGTAMDTVAAASVKLTAALSKTDDEGDAAAKALGRLGISYRDFIKLAPVEQLEQVAKKLGEFEVGAGKTAVAVALFGKSGADLIPFLNDLNDAGGRNVRLTAEQIEAADKFSKQIATLRSEFTQLGRTLGAEVLPYLNQILTLTNRLARGPGLLASIGEVFKGNTFMTASEGLEFYNKQVFALDKKIKELRSDTRPLVRAFNDEEVKRLEAERKKMDQFAQSYYAAAVAVADPTGRRPGGSSKKQLDGSNLNPDKKDKAEKDDPTKRLLENQLKKDFEAFADRERDLMSSRLKFLDLYNSQSLLSISAYYEAQTTILDAGTSAQVKAIDDQIAALERYKATVTKKTDEAEIEGKILALRKKRAKVENDAGERAYELQVRQSAEQERFADQVKGLSAEVLQLQGNLAAAAAIRFDVQNADLVRKATAEGNEEALKLLGTLRQLTISSAEFAQKSGEAQKVADQLAMTEERIAISRQLGATTELGALKALGEARQNAASEQLKYVQSLERIAALSKDDGQIRQAARARLEYERLAASADPLGDKFRTVFTESLSSPLAEFIRGTKSAKEAWKDFGSVVLDQLARIAAEEVALSIFGKSGRSGGGAGGGLGALDGVLAWLSGRNDPSSANYENSFDRQNASSGGSSWTSLLSGAMSFFGGWKAAGGDVLPGRAYTVGEMGPETFVPRTAGTILPANATAGARRSITQNISITVPGTVTRENATQLGADIARRLRLAEARNR